MRFDAGAEVDGIDFGNVAPKADPILAWSSPTDITFGTLLSNTQLNATANVAGAFTYTPALGTQLNAGANQQLNVSFTPSDTMNYNPVAASVVIGVVELLDYGDAPTAVQSGFVHDYPVTLSQDGARHSTSALFLGHLFDTEVDGQPDLRAGRDAGGGDDEAGVADEDEVSVIVEIVAMRSVSTVSSVSVIASQSGKVDGWIDFNQDGDWLDAGEQIFASRSVLGGSNLLSFNVPAGATPGMTFARFRLSTAGGLSPTGAAPDGEVEDYQLRIVDGDLPDGVEIQFVTSPTSAIEIRSDAGDVVVTSGGSDLFRATDTQFRRIDVVGTDADDTLIVADVSLLAGFLVIGDLGSGNDTLRIAGRGQNVTPTTIATIRGLEMIDIGGTGSNTLTLDAATVAKITSAARTLRVVHDTDDHVTYGSGWTIATPEISDGKFIHVLTQNGEKIQVENQLAFQNPLRGADSNHDGSVSPLDALIIINRVNLTGPTSLATPTFVDPLSDHFYIDTSGDSQVSPIDVLIVFNLLNASQVNAEGEEANWFSIAVTPPVEASISVRFAGVLQLPISDVKASSADVYFQSLEGEDRRVTDGFRRTESSRKAKLEDIIDSLVDDWFLVELGETFQE